MHLAEDVYWAQNPEPVWLTTDVVAYITWLMLAFMVGDRYDSRYFS